MMQAGLTMVDARFELRENCSNFRHDYAETETRLRWARLQSAKRRAGGIGFPYWSCDDQIAWMARLGAGVEDERISSSSSSSSSMRLGWRHSVMMVSRLNRSLLLPVLFTQLQWEPSPPVTSGERFTLPVDKPDMVDGDVVFDVAVRREPSMTEKFGGSGVLGFGTQQQQEVSAV